MARQHTGLKLPHNMISWEAETKRYGTVSIHNLNKPVSASGITEAQFLSLKVVWPNLGPKLHAPEHLYGDKTAIWFDSSEKEIQAEKEHMEEYDKAWTEYLNAIRRQHRSEFSRKLGVHISRQRRSDFSRKLGAYALVLESQMETARMKHSHHDSEQCQLTPTTMTTCSHLPSYVSATQNIAPELPHFDEQIVNAAAINFLKALFIHQIPPASWTLERKCFRFESGFVKFEARSDGHLQVHGLEERSAAILEVKARLRSREKAFHIEMQESAEMALWIFQEPHSHWAPSKEKGKEGSKEDDCY
jgi:hypothetical protein